MKKMKENKKTLVFYIDVRLVEQDDIPIMINKITKKITPSYDAEIIFIPVLGESKVECIDPIYITNSELIKKHERLMAKLHEHLYKELND